MIQLLEKTIDSRKVAEMVGKTHDKVIRDIRNIITQLGDTKNGESYFIESTYINSQNKELPCFLLTKKGCELFSTRMTGAKGTQFAAHYVQVFNEMEQRERQTIIQFQIPQNYAEALRLAADQAEENEKLKAENEIQAQRIAEYEPKVNYLDKILSSKKTVTVTQIAADYGISAQKLNKILREERVQRKVNNQWILYRNYMNNGYTKSDTINIVRSNGSPDVQMQTKWTQKGRLFIHELLENRGIIALMDIDEQ